MKIQKGLFVGAVSMPKVNLAIDLVDDGIEFSTVYTLGDGEQYSGPRWTKDGSDYGLIHRYRFDCSDLRANAQWSDVGSWHIYRTSNNVLYAENLFASTYSSKASSAQYANATDRLPVAVVYVPWATSAIGDAHVFLQIDPESVLIPGADVEIENYAGNAADWRASLLPEVLLAGPETIAPDAVADYSIVVGRGGVRDTTCGADVCIETTGGYLPLQRVRAQSGQASFRLSAAGLLSGEQIKLKVGFRNYSALATKTVHIA